MKNIFIYDENDFQYDDLENNISVDTINSKLLDDEEDDNSIDNNFSFNEDDIINGMIEKKTTKKKTYATSISKKAVETVYDVGANVVYKKKNAVVLFGPYERNYKSVYELQMEDGSIVSAISTSIHY